MTRTDVDTEVDSSYSSDEEGDGGSSSQASPVPRTKHTFSYFTVQDRHTLSEHLYVAPPSHGGVRVAAPSGLHPSSTHTLRAHFRSAAKRPPFDAEMLPVQYTECVSVASVPAHTERSCVAYCDVVREQRCKETVRMREVLSPVRHKAAIVCRTDCTKKNFKTVVDYFPKLRPRVYSETCYVLPQRLSQTYVAFVDYHVDTERKWYTTTVQLKPKTHSDTTVHNFQMLQDDPPQLVDSDGEDIPDSDSDSDSDRFDVSITNVARVDGDEDCRGLVDFLEGEPPHQESYRTHFIVNGVEGEPKVNNDINGNVSDAEDRYTSVYNHHHHHRHGGRYRSMCRAGDTPDIHDSRAGDTPDNHDSYSAPDAMHNGYMRDDDVHM